MWQNFTAIPRFALHYWRYRQRRFASREQLHRWQSGQVRKHLRFVLSHSPYYRNLFAGRDLDKWQELPISDKNSMMENFESLNTLGISYDEAMAAATTAERTRNFRPTIRGATIGLSTGTSGVRSLFLSQPSENTEFVAAAVAKLARGNLFTKQRIAFFHRAHGNLYRDLNTGRLQHQFFDLSEQLEDHFARLKTFDPTMIIGPPTVLYRLGTAKRDGRAPIKPRGLLSVAEVLHPDQRSQIEADFQVRVDEAYIATEGFIAATCSHGSLHLNEDMMVIQRHWVDRHNRRFVPILTDFRRRSQPIIRYRLDDVLVDSTTSCECGSPFAMIEQIEGRWDDVLVLKSIDSEATRRVFPDFVRQAASFIDQRIRDFRIIQEATDRLIVQIDSDDLYQVAAEESVRKSLATLFQRLGCAAPAILFEPYVVPDQRTKQRRVIRNFHSELA